MIGSFTGKYNYLSNFYPCEVELDGEIYQSTEHAFQAAKTDNPDSRKKIRDCGYAGQAKRLGRAVSCRSDWDDVRINIMTDLVRQKFTKHLDLQEKLLETGNRKLVEGNWHGDTFWGTCGGHGENYLGKILMEIREELRP